MPTSIFSRARALGAVPLALIGFAAMTAPALAESRTFDTRHHTIEVTQVADGFSNPWAVAFLPDRSMLITERDGDMVLIDPEGNNRREVRNVPRVAAGGQGGLLDVVVDPDFASNNTIFLSYSEPGSGGERGTAVARAELDVSGNRPSLENVTVIFQQQPKTRGGRHFGSRIVFARDGTLMVTLGDRGDREEAQNRGNHIGKVVRINKDGSVPSDNPFLNTDGALPELWSIGHRNAQGAALHPETGKLWTSAHGARGGDEINIPEAGKNYGWPVISYGRHYSGAKIGTGTEAAGMEQPVHYWDPSIAPSGLTFYSGRLFPEWRGNLFAGALKDQLISRLELSGERVASEERILTNAYGRIRDVREGPEGALWFLTDRGNGGLYRITPAQ